jgi:hypothetical protein
VPYIPPTFEIDEEALTQRATDIFQARVPAWQPSGDDDFALAIIQTFVRLCIDLLSTMASQFDEAFASWGATILGVQPLDAFSARGTATFTLAAAAPTGGFVIPAFTAFSMPLSDGTSVELDTQVDLTIPAGSTTGTVPVAAAVPGAVYNGLSGAGSMISALPGLSATTPVSVTSATAGGGDAETMQAYLDRIADYASVMGLHAVVSRDYATIAKLVEPEVYRAMGIDGYKSSDNSSGNARYETVVLMSATGGAVSSTAKTNVQAQLAALREQNFTVDVIDPLPTAITVVAVVVAKTGATTSAVAADVRASLAAVLNPLTWGAPTSDFDPEWSPRPIVYYNDVVWAVRNVPGVDHITNLTINGDTANITLSGGRPHAVPTFDPASTVTVS